MGLFYILLLRGILVARLIFDGLTKEQAEELANWYTISGEQSADDHFDIVGECEAPMVDTRRKIEHDGDDVIVHCK